MSVLAAFSAVARPTRAGTPELNRMITADVPYRETWTAMEQLVSDGLCKNIGVSNLTCQSLMEIKTYCKIPPAVNQVEVSCLRRRLRAPLHPRNPRLLLHRVSDSVSGSISPASVKCANNRFI